MFREEQFQGIIREFEDNGIHRFVFPYHLIMEILFEHPEKENLLRELCFGMGVEFSSIHGLYGKNYDLNIPDPIEHQHMVKSHIAAMELGKRFGSQTYTVHPGAYYHVYEHMSVKQLRANTIRTLEELAPEAERIGIILAVENSFEETNSPEEVLSIIAPFSGNSFVGVCYDSGHANCMSYSPMKKKEAYPDYIKNAWWENGFRYESHALELLHDHIVTCHLHDNDGYHDLHAMPGDGTVSWKDLLPRLLQCPRMHDCQTEVNTVGGSNWAGVSPAPTGGYSIRRLTQVFQTIFKIR